MARECQADGYLRSSTAADFLQQRAEATPVIYNSGFPLPVATAQLKRKKGRKREGLQGDKCQKERGKNTSDQIRLKRQRKKKYRDKIESQKEKTAKIKL